MASFRMVRAGKAAAPIDEFRDGGFVAVALDQHRHHGKRLMATVVEGLVS